MKEDNRTIRRAMLVIGNIAIVAAILMLSYMHIRNHREENVELTKDAFVEGVSSIRQTAATFLDDAKKAACDRAEYISTEGMTMEEALEFLSKSNTDVVTMAHIIDYDTATGYSSVGDTEVDYSSFIDNLSLPLDRLRSDEITNGYITSTFTNPVTHYSSIGFLGNVTLSTDDGDKNYLMIWIVPSDYAQSKWIFPSQFEGAELSLIAASGRYIIKGKSLKYQNFWEYVRIYNELGYDETDAIRDSFYSGDTRIRELRDNSGDSYYAVCLPYSDDNDDLYFVATIPAESLETAEMDYSLVIIVSIGMFLLLFFNSFYMIDMNRKLRRSNALALEASRAKTDFLSSMSHDIRTPMNAIIGMTEIAHRSIDDKNKVSECLTKISLAGNHLVTLINDILDISKIESGKFTLSPTEFVLSDLVDEQVSIMQQQIEAKGHTLEVHADNLPAVRLFADELRLNQIFINILSNAVKYTDSGGRIEVNVEETVSGSSADIVYSVKDNGIGMTQEFMDVMFEPFRRMTDTRLNKTQGTGLGLAITKQIIDLMGGSIDCESEPGVGSTFTVRLTLPVAEGKSDDTSDETDIGEEITLSLVGKHILVAEDNDMNWEVVSEILAMYGIETVRAENGKAAVEMLEEAADGTYDMVLMDIQMPVMNGIEATRTIRAMKDEKKSEVPIVAMTADAFTEDVQACLDAGMNAHTAKPVNIKKLITTIYGVTQR